MAKPKKKISKPAAKKPVARKAAKPAKSTRSVKSAKPVVHHAKRAVEAPLSQDERQRMLKPRAGADDVADDAVVKWGNERGLRVDDLTRAKLARFVREFRKWNAKETALADKQARQMQPVRDGRVRASDALWRALLDLRAAVGLRARKDPTIEERFGALIDALKNDAAADPMPPAA